MHHCAEHVDLLRMTRHVRNRMAGGGGGEGGMQARNGSLAGVLLAEFE